MNHFNLLRNFSFDCQKSGTYNTIINNDTNFQNLHETKYSTIKLVKNTPGKLPKIVSLNQNENNNNEIDALTKSLVIVNNSLKLKNNSVNKLQQQNPFLSLYRTDKNKLKSKTKYVPENKFSYISSKSINKSAIYENFNFTNKNYEKITNITIRQTPIITPNNNHSKNYKFFYNDIKLKNPKNFHKKLMLKNIEIYNNSKLNEYLEMQHKEKLLELEKEKTQKENASTGIYGSPKNIVSKIRAKMERLKMDDDYEKVKPELRELVKDELMIAEVKLKIKPKKIKVGVFNQSKPFKKLEKFKYLSQKNEIIQLNRNGNTPMVIKDDQIIYNLFDDAYRIFKEKKYQVDNNAIL